MKCTIPEISWHNREPVLCVHIQPVSEGFYRLATGGADCHILIWHLVIAQNGAVKVEALSDLTRHQRAVNVVRWSPNGQYLASADDDANIIIWKLKTDNIPLLEGETNDKEIWIVHKIMRGHKEDIYDLCWSPNSLKLLTGSIDNTAILWDLTKGKSELILTDHKGFVQGVAWDPKGQFISTISTDRICRIYESSGKQVKFRIQRGVLPVPETHYLYNKDIKYFHDDTFKSFFRRLDFSPDGSLLAAPSAKIEVEDCKKTLNGTLIFAVESWSSPVSILPSGKQCSTVVKFCPVLFEIQDDGPESIISLPYRMILAVGTDHDVILYDTQQKQPFAYFKDIHYTRLTDLTWSNDGLLLIASSTDGYCALITFEVNELGIEYTKEESEVEDVSFLNISGCEELENEDTTEIVKPKKLNLLEKWTVKTPKKTDTTTTISHTTSTKKESTNAINVLVPKRIKPISINKDDKTTKDGSQTPKNVKGNEATTKASPLLNFLKPIPKEKPRKTETTPTATIIIDENEARDAWKCEKDEVQKMELEKIVHNESTEDFSLHLEDTNTQPSNNEIETVESNTISNTSEKKKDLNELIEDNKITQQTERVHLEQLPENNKEISKEEIKNNALPMVTTIKPQNTEEKVTIHKRRIPLITLSSPKQKKK